MSFVNGRFIDARDEFQAFNVNNKAQMTIFFSLGASKSHKCTKDVILTCSPRREGIPDKYTSPSLILPEESVS